MRGTHQEDFNEDASGPRGLVDNANMFRGTQERDAHGRELKTMQTFKPSCDTTRMKAHTTRRPLRMLGLAAQFSF